MKRAQEKLTRASHKLAEIMYREAQGPTQQPTGAPGGEGRAASGPRRVRWWTRTSRTWATRRSSGYAARLLRRAGGRVHGGAARGAPGVPTARAAVLARRELLGRPGPRPLRRDRRGVPRAER